MALPDVGIIDTMLDLPFRDVRSTYEFLIPNLRDAQSRALRQHPDRFLPSIGVDPNDAMAAVEQIVRAHETTGLAALPMALMLERIFAELPDVPLDEDVWPKFLRHNAARVLNLR